MQAQITKRELAKQLQAKINAMQGLGAPKDRLATTDLNPFAAAFPGRVFPKTAIHEFISYEPADAACTNGFIAALSGKFMKEGNICLWIGNEKKVFTSGLKHFGLQPDRIVFIRTPNAKEALWIVEEALKCEALTTVIAEIKELGFTESRRLQLAVEQSGVTGFIHRYRPFSENAVACTTRWKVSALPSEAINGLPGLGYSSWDIQLLKVRNGKPDSWQVSWSGKNFTPVVDTSFPIEFPERQAG